MFKALKKKMKDQRGLTLIELLAVIVILGIIAAIAIPSIGKIISNSEDDAVIADALQIINAAKIASAAGVDGPWDYDDLGEYITKAGDEDFTVSETDGKYSIVGHDAATVLKKTTPATAVVTEADLVTASN
jgi:type IV pilus assembly protein PilA